MHPGHVKVFKEAKGKGDILIVGLNSDISIKKIKGPGRPILNQIARADVLSAIQYIDYLVVFNESTPYQLIKTLKPNILVKGGDWGKDEIVGRDIVDEVIRIKPIKKYSTTLIINKIQKKVNGQ